MVLYVLCMCVCVGLCVCGCGCVSVCACLQHLSWLPDLTKLLMCLSVSLPDRVLPERLNNDNHLITYDYNHMISMGFIPSNGSGRMIIQPLAETIMRSWWWERLIINVILDFFITICSVYRDWEFLNSMNIWEQLSSKC